MVFSISAEKCNPIVLKNVWITNHSASTSNKESVMNKMKNRQQGEQTFPAAIWIPNRISARQERKEMSSWMD